MERDALNRRSRLTRCANAQPVELTPRDLEIFRVLARYRFLRSTSIHALVGGKSQKRFIERLGRLYHDGLYLDRPVQQWNGIDARCRPTVYELSPKGHDALAGYQGRRGKTQVETPGKGRLFQHELMVSEIVAALEAETRQTAHLRFIDAAEILAKAPESIRGAPNPLALPILVNCRVRGNAFSCDKPLVPDALFGVEYEEAGRKSYRFFALEADRDTEPLRRGDLVQSSYFRKVLQYREAIAVGLHKSHWSIPNLFVLTVTTSEPHLRNMLRLILEMSGTTGSTRFLFMALPADVSSSSARQLLTRPWQRAGNDPFRIDIC